jgi:hypothetical protein
MKDEYKKIVHETLASFQILEFSLKIYISSAYVLIKHKTANELTFDYSYKDIKSHSLERLSSIFKKLTNNNALSKRIGKLIYSRNKLAHAGLLIAEEIFRDILGENLEEEADFISRVHIDLDSCLEDMANEIRSITSILSKYNLPAFEEQEKGVLFK